MAINITKTFCWNVLDYIQVSKTFEWRLGDGPLYWFRIEWKDPLCEPRSCISDTSVCSITATECECIETANVETHKEVWHVLATSVEHLCKRLNDEVCLVKPTGKVFDKVQQYQIPALCCDVEKLVQEGAPLDNSYIDVDFCKCECVSWVDPCDCGDIYTPCDPCADLVAPTPMMMTKPKMFSAGFVAETIEITKPQLSRINVNQMSLASSLKLKHNLKEANNIKQFLSRYKQKLPDEIDLVYNKSSDSWQKTYHLQGNDEKWTLFFEWLYREEFNQYGWRYHLHVTKQIGRNKQNSRVTVLLNTKGSSKIDNLFTISFNLNTKTNMVAVPQSVVVQEKDLYDGILLFSGDWAKDPYMKVQLTDKKV